MINDLDEYYNHITYINKDIAVYEDDEGNYFNVSPVNLLANCLYQELDKEQLKQAVFNQNIPKDMIFPKKKTTKVVVKSDITHKPKDNTTLVDKEIEVNQVWAVANGMQVKKVYNTKDEAMNKAKEINEKIFEVLGIETYKSE